MTTCQGKLNRALSTSFRAHLKILVLRARKHEGLPWLAGQKPCHKPFLIWSTMYFNFPKYSAEILAKRGLAPFSWQVNEMQSSLPASGEGHAFRAVPCPAPPPGGFGGDCARCVRAPAPCPHVRTSDSLVGSPVGFCRNGFCCSESWGGGGGNDDWC